jgi:hypothetical protein
MSDGLLIDWLGGNCPVQAEGTVDGRPFYFRARGQRWSLEVADETGRLDYWHSPDSRSWFYQEPWGEGDYAAGWMPESDARDMIDKGVAIWRSQRQS